MDVLAIDFLGFGEPAPAPRGHRGGDEPFGDLLRGAIESDGFDRRPTDRAPRPERTELLESTEAPTHEPRAGEADEASARGGDEADAAETAETPEGDEGETGEAANAADTETSEQREAESGAPDASGTLVAASHGLAMVEAHANSDVAKAVLSLIASSTVRTPSLVGETARTAAGAVPIPVQSPNAVPTPAQAPNAAAPSGQADAGPLARAAVSVAQAPTFALGAAPREAANPPEAANQEHALLATQPARVTLTHEGHRLVSQPSSTLAPEASLAVAADETETPAAIQAKPTQAGPKPNAAAIVGQALEQRPEARTAALERALALKTGPVDGTAQPQAQGQPQVQTGSAEPAANVIANGGEIRHSSPVQNAAAQPPRPAAELPAPFEQVAVHIHRAVSEGLDRINIQLRPASLGHIGVRLELNHDGRVTAVIAVDRPETLDLLQRDARGLERALEQAGLRTDSGSLSFNLSHHNRGDMPPFEPVGGSTAADGLAATDGPEPTVASLADEAGWIDLARGGIDIRV
jgi:hypothetical protein